MHWLFGTHAQVVQVLDGCGYTPSHPTNYAVSCTHSAWVSFHVNPASQDIASRFALLCLAQLPASKLDAVMLKIKMLADINFMLSLLKIEYLIKVCLTMRF